MQRPAATDKKPTKFDELQEEISKESTVCDIDGGRPKSCGLGAAVSKQPTNDIDELASQSQQSDSEREEARVKAEQEKSDDLERMEQELLAFNDYETTSNKYFCTACSDDRSETNEIVVTEDYDTSKWA